MLLIKNATLVMRDHLMPDAALLIDGGLIAAIGAGEMTPPEGADVIDAGGMNVAPGFIDIHVHAGGTHNFADEPGAAAEFMLKHGVTTILPTISYTLTLDEMLAAFDRYDAAAETHKSIAGINMEGPYMNAQYGAQADENKWAGTLDPKAYNALIDRLGTRAKIWSVGPEREGIIDFLIAARKNNPNVIFSAGHTEADAYQTEALMPYGLRLATHLSNAMHNRVIYEGCVRPYVVDAALANESIYAEIICDSMGIHVNPYLLRLYRHIKGDSRIILISDSTVPQKDAPANLREAKDLNFDRNGGISGSRLTLDVACRNMMVHTGASIVDVVRFASYNPAELLGMKDRGEIAVGKTADLIMADDRMNIQNVFLKGERVAL